MLDAERFEKFMEQELRERLKKKSERESRTIKVNKNSKGKPKKKYAPKHLTPMNIFNYHGVDINVLFGEFNTIGSHSRVIFYNEKYLETFR